MTMVITMIRCYDREVVARRAMELFWLHGFHGTTTEALAEHMGVNRFSLLAERAPW